MKRLIGHLTERQLEVLWNNLMDLTLSKPILVPLLHPTFDELVTDDVWNQAVAAVEGENDGSVEVD